MTRISLLVATAAAVIARTSAEAWTLEDLEKATSIGDASKCYYALFEGACGTNGGVYQISTPWYTGHYGGAFSGLNCGTVVENWPKRSGSHKSYAASLGSDLGTNAIYQDAFDCTSVAEKTTLAPQNVDFDVAELCADDSTVYSVPKATGMTGVTFCSQYIEADKEYEMLMLIENTVAWGSVGFNKDNGQMVGTEVMWLGVEDGAATLKYKKNTEYSKPSDTSEQPKGLEVAKTDKGIQAKWRRPLVQGDLLTLTDDTSSLYMVFAKKDGAPGTFSKHDKYASVTNIKLTVAGASTGEAVQEVKATSGNLAHGALMLLAWGCLSPIATTFMKYGKHLPASFWFKGHMYLQALAILVAVIAFIIIVTSGVKFSNLDGKSRTHATYGFIVLGACIVQGLLGAFRENISAHVKGDGHSKDEYSHGPRRWLFNMLHRTNGWVIFALSLYTLYLGVTLFDVSATNPKVWLQEPAPTLFKAYCFVAAAMIVILELLHVTKYEWGSGGPFSCSGSTTVTDTFKAEGSMEQKVRTIALALFAALSIAVTITMWVIVADTNTGN